MALTLPTKPSLLLLLLVVSLSLASCSNSSTNPIESCQPSGYVHRKGGKCYGIELPICCQRGKLYPRYRCSPPVTEHTSATMLLNSFPTGSDYPTACDGKFHTGSEHIVALSTGWYGGGSRCLERILIHGNGRSVVAKVVDECDSVNGCDADHDYQPPCANNIVDASLGVWEALGVPSAQIGQLNITWSDAVF